MCAHGGVCGFCLLFLTNVLFRAWTSTAFSVHLLQNTGQDLYVENSFVLSARLDLECLTEGTSYLQEVFCVFLPNRCSSFFTNEGMFI